MLHKLPLSVQLFSSIVYVIIFNCFCNSQLTLSLRSKLIFMFYCLFMVMQIALSRSNGAITQFAESFAMMATFLQPNKLLFPIWVILSVTVISYDDFHLGIVAVGENLLMHKAVTSKYLPVTTTLTKKLNIKRTFLDGHTITVTGFQFCRVPRL